MTALAKPSGLVLGAQTSSYVTQEELAAQMAGLQNLIHQELYSSTSTYASGGIWNAIAASQRISNLQSSPNAPLVISGATVNGVSGLTAADIPHDIVAANYLPLAGGTLTGSTTVNAALTVNGDLSGTNLTLSGTLTANALSVAGVSSGGAITAPYFTATSSAATSTFSGSILGLGTLQIDNSAYFFGPASFGTTGTTTIATNGTLTAPSVFANSATAYVITTGSLTATSSLAVFGPAYFGSTATSSFDAAGNLFVAGTTTLTFATTTNLAITGTAGALLKTPSSGGWWPRRRAPTTPPRHKSPTSMTGR